MSPSQYEGTIFADHTCGSRPRTGDVPLLSAHQPFQPAPASGFSSIACGMPNPSTAIHLAKSGKSVGPSATADQVLNRPWIGNRRCLNQWPLPGGMGFNPTKFWWPTEISEPAHCRSLLLPANLTHEKISRLIYTHSGNSILAMASNGIHLLWQWQVNDHSLNGEVTASVAPELRHPRDDILMINYMPENTEEATPCFALFHDDSYLLSASGGMISFFSMETFERLGEFLPLRPAATSLLLNPENSVMVVGREDSTIKIFDVRNDRAIKNLEGHRARRITGLTFSEVLNVLVSADEDAQLCVWKWDTWEKQQTTFLPTSSGWRPVSHTRVQFKQDQIHFIVAHTTQVAVYETTKLRLVSQWISNFVPITDATLSCDSQFVYASFVNAAVCVFSAADLQPRYRINPFVYLPLNVSPLTHPLVIAAHPSKPNQFALGLTDGSVYIIEPTESRGQWFVAEPPVENE